MANLVDLFFFSLTLSSSFFFFFFFFGNLSTRRIRQSPVPFCLMSLSLRYISFVFFPFFSLHVLPLPHTSVLSHPIKSSFGLHIYFFFFLILG